MTGRSLAAGIVSAIPVRSSSSGAASCTVSSVGSSMTGRSLAAGIVSAIPAKSSSSGAAFCAVSSAGSSTAVGAGTSGMASAATSSGSNGAEGSPMFSGLVDRGSWAVEAFCLFSSRITANPSSITLFRETGPCRKFAARKRRADAVSSDPDSRMVAMQLAHARQNSP